MFLLVLISNGLFGQDGVLGKWKTIDDETGKPKAIVELYMKGDQLHGRIVELINPSTTKCTNCEGDLKDKPLVGMDIVTKMKKSGNEWSKGYIFDPKKATTYGCKLWLDTENKNTLNVRGYWGFIFRTQQWIRL